MMTWELFRVSYMLSHQKQKTEDNNQMAVLSRLPFGVALV